MRPKGIAFSPDERLVAVCYGFKGGRAGRMSGRLTVFAFDEHGISPEPISSLGPEVACAARRRG
jgi:hypothetical protein